MLGLVDDDHIIGNIMTYGYWELCIILYMFYYVYFLIKATLYITYSFKH